MKQRREHPAPVVREAKKDRGSDLALLCLGAAAAANTACAGAPVRPVPAPEPCPPGATEVMGPRFDIAFGHKSPGMSLPGYEPFQGGRIQPIPVREGPVTLLLEGPWGNVPPLTSFSGRLIFGPEYVYSRITELQLPSGETFPVCFKLVSQGVDPNLPGIPIEGTGEPGTVKLFPLVRLEAVKSFE